MRKQCPERNTNSTAALSRASGPPLYQCESHRSLRRSQPLPPLIEGLLRYAALMAEASHRLSTSLLLGDHRLPVLVPIRISATSLGKFHPPQSALILQS